MFGALKLAPQQRLDGRNPCRLAALRRDHGLDVVVPACTKLATRDHKVLVLHVLVDVVNRAVMLRLESRLQAREPETLKRVRVTERKGVQRARRRERRRRIT